jgi:hypothetical protein
MTPAEERAERTQKVMIAMNSRRTVPTRTPRRRWRVLPGVVLAIGVVMFGVGALATTATAEPSPSIITDYGSYPADLPDGCPDGAEALEGLSFSNGRGGEAGDLRALDVRHGDTVTMSWTGFADGCTADDGSPAIAVSLAVYETSSPVFDPGVDGPLLPGAESCGDGAGSCGSDADGYSLSISLPTAPEACNVQLDAVLGLPLGMIGPNGSYYSPIIRGGGPNMLVSAANFGLEPCEEAPPTTTSTSTTAPEEQPTTTTTTTAPPEVEDTTTTTEAPEEEATTTTTEAGIAPTTTEAPPTQVSQPSAVSPATVPAAVLPSSVEATGNQVLPFTGAAHTTDYVRLGMLLAGAGAALAGIGGFWLRRRPIV